MKKILAFAIALSLCTTGLYIPNKFNLTLSNINANAETSASDFDFDAETGTITSYTGSDTVVEVPSMINGVTVTKIGYRAFYLCNNVTDIIIPNTVTNIGDGVFMLCNSLSNITIPESVTTIGNNFIYSCFSLKNIFIPASVTSIGECSFGLSYYGITITGYENTAAQKLAEESGKTFISLGTAPEKSKYILGEVTGDGIIDATDASFILTAYAKSSTNEDDGINEEQRKFADVNKDGSVDAVDASAVLHSTLYLLQVINRHLKSISVRLVHQQLLH